MLTAGHSAAGLFCRNLGYWKPHRTIAVVMIKSGNFHHALEDMDASLKTVPLIHFSGEFECFGPEGGDLGAGLRSAYITEPKEGPVRRKNQTQWVMTRMQMLDRRRKHEDNVWSLVVHRGGGHTSWNKDMTALFIKYLHRVVAARLPAGEPDGKTEVRCVPLTAKGGWLYDADIKNPQHEPAPYAEYAGDKQLAFWAPDEATARAIYEYHQRDPWAHPDPTEKEPVEKRFYPPPILKDYIDSPPPPVLTWGGGDGQWTKAGKEWQADGAAAAYDGGKQAVFAGDGGTVTVPANVGCTGLTLGKGWVLDLGGSRVSSRWHGNLAAGSEVRVKLHKKSPSGAGRWGASISIDGNGTVGARLVVTIEEGLEIGTRAGLREGDYGILRIKGRRQGDFAEVVLPEFTGTGGTNKITGRWIGGCYCVTVPKLLKGKDLENWKKAQERKKDGGIFNLDGPPKKKDDPDADPLPKLNLP
jgi:hypothetical protein